MNINFKNNILVNIAASIQDIYNESHAVEKPRTQGVSHNGRDLNVNTAGRLEAILQSRVAVVVANVGRILHSMQYHVLLSVTRTTRYSYE